MNKSSIWSKITQWNRRIDSTAAIISAVLVMLIMLITFSDVVGRNLFRQPIVGGIEVVTELFVIALFLSIAYVELEKRQIAVDFVIQRVSAKTRDKLILIGLIISLIVFLFLAWRCSLDMMWSWRTGESSFATVNVPYAPTRTVIFLGFVLLSITDIILIVERVKILRQSGKSNQETTGGE